MSLTSLNANEFPFCALTSGVPLDVLTAPLTTSMCSAPATIVYSLGVETTF